MLTYAEEEMLFGIFVRYPPTVALLNMLDLDDLDVTLVKTYLRDLERSCRELVEILSDHKVT